MNVLTKYIIVIELIRKCIENELSTAFGGNYMTTQDSTQVSAWISAQIPYDLKLAIRIEAAKLDRPMSEIIREALQLWLHIMSDNGGNE